MGGFGLTILLGIAIGFAALLGAGLFYQWRGHARDRRRFPAPGRMVDIGGVKLHADMMGRADGTPPVIFEAGIAATSLSWRLVQSEAAKFAQTVSYDRAGLGWSEAASSSQGRGAGECDVWRLLENLRALLDRMEIAKPRILVAHSFGGLIATAYALRYPEELAGVVLVDPVGAEEWAEANPRNLQMLRRAIFLSRFGEALARLGVVRFTLSLLSRGSKTAPKLIARAASGQSGQAFTERIAGQIGKLPKETWPMIQSHWTDPKCFRAMARQLAALPGNAAAVLRASEVMETPMIVLSASDASAAQRESQERLSHRSTHGRLEIVEGSGHWIMLDRPSAVIAAIRELAAVNPSSRRADPSVGANR